MDIRYRYPLGRDVLAEVIITGPNISSTDIQMLMNYLKLTSEALADETVIVGD